MSTAKRWLLVDGNSLVTYLWFRGPNKDTAAEVWLYIADTLVRFDLCHIAVAWDHVYVKGKTGQGASTCRRRQQYKEYKGNRGGHPQWALARPRVLKEVKESLKQLPVVQGTLEELEADDVLWCWTQMIGGLIISGDEDLLQCCNKDVQMWSPRKKELIGLSHIKERFGSVQAMMVQKALVGDTSDNVSGVLGIGWSRAKKLWEEKSDLLLAALEGVLHLHEDDKWMLCVIDQVEVFKRNWKIIKLGEIIDEKDMMKAETFLMQPVKFDLDAARHYAAYKGFMEVIRKWDQVSAAFQRAVPPSST